MPGSILAPDLAALASSISSIDMRILIVEDNPQIAETLFDYLEGRGHDCLHAASLRLAQRALNDNVVDVAVFDRMLADGDGLSLVSRLRAEGSSVPILMLTARDALEDKLAGFESGVDDYLVKPFALQEVEARLQALARRMPQRSDVGVSECGALQFDAAAQEARLAGVTLKLPPKGVRLAAILIQQPERVLSRLELETAIWGREQESSDNLRSLLHTFRRALETASAQSGRGSSVDLITVHGLGYKLVAKY